VYLGQSVLFKLFVPSLDEAVMLGSKSIVVHFLLSLIEMGCGLNLFTYILTRLFAKVLMGQITGESCTSAVYF